MKSSFILRIFDLFKFIFIKSGIDYEQFRLLMQLKFILDKRKVIGNLQFKVKEESKFSPFLVSRILLMLGGIVLSLMMYVMNKFGDIYFMLLFFFSILMYMIFQTGLGELEIDLFNNLDTKILGTKPIRKSTLTFAKLFHFFLYILDISFSFSLFPILFVFILMSKILGIIFLFEVFLISILTTTLLANLFSHLYGKYCAKKVKKILLSISLGVLIVVFLGIKMIPVLLTKFPEQIMNFPYEYLLYVFPPAWFSSFFRMIELSTLHFSYLISVGLIGIAIIINFIYFFKKTIRKMEQDYSRLESEEISVKLEKKTFLGSKFFSSQSFKAFADFSNIIIFRESYTLKNTLPTIIYVMIVVVFMPIQMIFIEDVVITQTKYFFTLYMMNILLVQIILYYALSENNKADWLFRVLPIKRPSKFIQASHFVLFFKLQILPILICFSVYAFIWKFKIISDLIIIFLNFFIFQIFALMISKRRLPFTLYADRKALFEMNFGYIFILGMIINPILAGIHFFVTLWGVGVYFLIPFQLVSVYFLFKNYYDIDWQDLEY